VVVLGLLLVLLSGALALGVVLSNTDPVSASAFGVTLSNVSVGGLFLVGAVTGVVLMLGLVMLLAGAARKRSRRVATKRQVRNVRSEKEQLAEENAELRARLADPYPPTTAGEPATKA
jgi:hypothetical protein